MLANENIEDAVINKIWDVAKTNKNLYVDQYDYRRFGGEDPPKWKMNELAMVYEIKRRSSCKCKIKISNEIC